MSKRHLNLVEEKSKKAKQTKHWSLGLLDSMKDPESIVINTKHLVVIRDKYPKAKLHYLVLPHNDIHSIYKLDNSHKDLLQEFHSVYTDIQQDNKDIILHAGFHAIPSMQRLHMHIISKDMVSPCLKTKVHWNSFTTRFFKPLKDVLVELEQNGCIQKTITTSEHKQLLAAPLQCNQCTYKPKNMPELKDHLKRHLEKNS